MRPILFEIAGIPFYGYGVMQVFAAFTFAALLILGAVRFSAKSEAVVRACVAAGVGGVVGAKLLFVLVNLGQAPLWRLLTGSGVVFQGAIVGAAIALGVAALKGPMGAALDALFLAALGYWLVSNGGCLLAGCCVGVPTEGWWGLHFPGADETTQLFGLRRHALPLYTMVVELGLVGAMLAWAPRRPGERATAAAGLLLAWKALTLVTIAEPVRPPFAGLLVGLAVIAAIVVVVLRRTHKLAATAPPLT